MISQKPKPKYQPVIDKIAGLPISTRMLEDDIKNAQKAIDAAEAKGASDIAAIYYRLKAQREAELKRLQGG